MCVPPGFMNLDLRDGSRFAHGFQDPIAKTGGVQALPAIFDPRVLFTTLFGSLPVGGGGGGGGGGPTSTPDVDTIMANFRKVQNGRAISCDDKQLLQSHIDLFADLKNKLTAVAPTPVSAACVSPATPASRLAINECD